MKSKETFYVVFLSCLLVIRTLLSIWLADVNGSVVKAIVNRKWSDFLKKILALMLFAIPASTVNSGLDYYNKKLGLAIRDRLTRYFHDKYLKKMFYYKICNLDSRISTPDQRLTTDLEKWSGCLSNLYLNLTKPILDIILFSKKLSDLVGWEGPALTVGWYFISGICIKLISPSFGKLTAKEQMLEGDYRAKHKELIDHSEEIAFYNGSLWEK